MILLVAVRVGRDMRVQQPDLTVLHGNVRILHLDSPGYDAFDLGTDEHRAGLVLVFDMIFVKCLAIGQDFLIDWHNVQGVKPSWIDVVLKLCKVSTS